MSARVCPLVLLASLACTGTSAREAEPAQPDTPAVSAPSGEGHWRYVARVDATLERMDLELCTDEPLPQRLVAGEGAIAFVRRAALREGELLEREGDALRIPAGTGPGCVALELDLAGLAGSSSRFGGQLDGDAAMLSPRQWLWHPERVPAQLDATLELELPEGVHVTAPWPVEGDRRRLERSAFRWDAWIAIGRFEPLVFEAAQAEFEVAVIGGEPAASADGIRRWISVAADGSAQLYGRFSRERVAVVVPVGRRWGGDPVLFGMARRGGGASAMLILADDAHDAELPGEWVATHEFLHFALPLCADPWLGEGFVTYYQNVVRARQGVLAGEAGGGDALDVQSRRALDLFAGGFERGASSRQTLAEASSTMNQSGAYMRVYWGGTAVALDLDVQLRRASEGKRSLDDLMRSMLAWLAEDRRFRASEVLERFDREVAQWHAAGELRWEIVPSEIAREHLEGKAIPRRILELVELAVEVDDGRVRLLDQPADAVALRRSIFAPLEPAPR